MQRAQLSILIMLVAGLVIITSGGASFAGETDLHQLNLATVNVQEIAEEQPAIQMHFETLLEVTEEVREERGYDLVFAAGTLLAGSEDMVEDITYDVQEKFGEEVDNVEEDLDLDF